MEEQTAEKETAENETCASETAQIDIPGSIMNNSKVERITLEEEEKEALKERDGKEIKKTEKLNAPPKDESVHLRAKLGHVKNLFEKVHKNTIALIVVFDNEQSATLLSIPKEIKKIEADLDVKDAQISTTTDKALSVSNYKKSSGKAIAKLENAIETSVQAYEAGKFNVFVEYNLTIEDVKTTLTDILNHSIIMGNRMRIDRVRKGVIKLFPIVGDNLKAFCELVEIMQKAVIIQGNLVEYKSLDNTSDEQKMLFEQHVSAILEYEKRFENIETELMKQRYQMTREEVLLKRVEGKLKVLKGDSKLFKEKDVYYTRYFESCHKAWKVDYLKKEAFLLLSHLKSVGVLFNIAVEGYLDIATDMKKHDINGNIDTFEDKFQALKNYDCDTLRQMSLEIILRLELFRTDTGLLKNTIEYRIDHLLQSIDNVEWTPQSEPKGKGKKVKQIHTKKGREKAYNQLKGSVKRDLEILKAKIAGTNGANVLRQVLRIDIPPIYEKYKNLTKTLKQHVK